MCFKRGFIITSALLTAFLTVSVGMAQDEDYGRDRYELIVARSPFGSDPLTPGEQSDRDAERVMQTLEKELRLCFLMESKTGEIRAGFQNLKAGKDEPKSIVLMEGDSFRAMKLIGIDLEDSSATLQYQGKTVKFELTKGRAVATPAAANANANAAAAAAARQPTRPQRRFGSGFRNTTPPVEEQQAQAQPQQPAPQPEVPPLTPEEQEIQREEIRARLQEYQMDVIRQGMPPLPIQLSQEQDDQLVEEGILPPIPE